MASRLLRHPALQTSRALVAWCVDIEAFHVIASELVPSTTDDLALALALQHTITTPESRTERERERERERDAPAAKVFVFGTSDPRSFQGTRDVLRGSPEHSRSYLSAQTRVSAIL